MIDRIINLSLKNRMLMVILTTLVIFAGYLTYTRLPIDAFPDVSPSLVQVFTVTEGLAPEEVEKYVTYPIEAKMTGLPRLKQIRSISNFGLSVISIYFEDGTDIYFARQVVNEKLQEAREEIPEGFGEPQMGPIATGQGQVLYYYLIDTTGKYSLTDLRTMQDWIVKFNLQTVPGVTEVLGIGGFEKQFHVIVDPNALLRYDVTLHDLIERIKANNLNVGAQFLERGGEQFIIRSVGLAQGIEDIESIIIKTVHGRPVYLQELADVKIGGAIRRGLQTRNGEEEVVAGMVIKLIGTNSSTVIALVEEKLEEIENALPEGVKIVPFYEQKSLVDASVSTVTNALIIGIVLVLFILFVFLGKFRPSLVVAGALPFSIMFAFIAMGYFGISANLMSLGGLAIAIGMIVDATIVMVENVDRMLSQAVPGDEKIQVISRSCLEVSRPIVFAISIIIIVFLPLFTLQGVEGKTFRPLAYTVALAMLGSLLYALFQAPSYSSLLMRSPGKNPAEKQENKSQEMIVVRILHRIYRPIIRIFVRSRWLAVALSVILIIIGLVVYPRLGSEFTPRLREGDIIVNLTFAPSTSLTETKRNIMLIERRFLEIPEVEEAVSRIGRGEVGAHSAPVNVSHMNVLLKPKSQWKNAKNQNDIEAALRHKLESLPGVLTNVTQPIQLSVDELIGGVKAELAIKLFGDDVDVLKEKADDIASIIREVRGAADIQVGQMTGAPQLLIRPDREAIARYGVNIEEVQEVIHAAVGGTKAGQIFEGIRRFDIYVRYKPEARSTADAIKEIIIETLDGQKVPLAQLATIKEIVGSRQIRREDNQRFITIQCNVIDRDIGSFVKESQRKIEQEVKLPTGYFVTWGGQFELQQEANRRFAVVIPVTLGIICLLLYMSFGSLRSSLLILLNIPLALVGGVVALWLTGQNLSVPASVGFIALFGIALENGMVLVTYLNQLLRDGLPIDETSIRAATLRIRPVLMTAMTTALGLIPLALSTGTGSEVQRPLAIVVIGGLITSTILTLLVIPSVYKWFAIKVEYVTND